MNPDMLVIAKDKANSKEEKQTIEELIFLSKGIYNLTIIFPTIINACQVMRGEKPPKYTKKEQEEIEEYKKDALTIDKEHIENAKKTETAVSIIGPIYIALKSDIKDEINWLRYYKKGE